MTTEVSKDNTSNAIPSLTVDWEAYGHFLDESDLTDEQKRELIETVWAIVVGFVDLGFKVKSPEKSCGQDFAVAAAISKDVLNSPSIHMNKMNSEKVVSRSDPAPKGRTP